MLVLLLGRPELVRTAGALTRLADAEVHTLPPLRGADAARLLTSYLNGGKLPQPDTDRLLATAQGNPFYLAELVTLLMERGRADHGGPSRGDGRRTLAAGARLAGQPAALPRPRRRAGRPHRRAAGRARSVLRDAAVVGDTVPPARSRRCASGAAAATAARPRWSPSSWSARSTSCSQRRMLHRVPAAGTRSPPR